jgi:hypothetical protein
VDPTGTMGGTGSIRIKSIGLVTLETDELTDTSSPHGLVSTELMNTILSNANATGAIEYDAPARAENWNFVVVCEEAQNIVVDPNGTEQWYLNGSQLAAGENIQNTACTKSESMACFSTEEEVYCESKYSDWAEETP